MTKAIILTIIVHLFTADAGPTLLCCHTHADGTVGCWPPNDGECNPGEKAIHCRGSASQTDPNDEESWQCDTYPNS